MPRQLRRPERKSSRRQAREAVLKSLFQLEFQGSEPIDNPTLVLEDLEVTPDDQEFALSLLHMTIKRQQDIDSILESFAKDWTIKRMARLERSILRMALSELLWFPNIPPAVTLDEAVELAKAYCAPEAASFVNGILGNIQNHLEELKRREEAKA